jgi:hypothetical protein
MIALFRDQAKRAWFYVVGAAMLAHFIAYLARVYPLGIFYPNSELHYLGVRLSLYAFPLALIPLAFGAGKILTKFRGAASAVAAVVLVIAAGAVNYNFLKTPHPGLAQIVGNLEWVNENYNDRTLIILAGHAIPDYEYYQRLWGKHKPYYILKRVKERDTPDLPFLHLYLTPAPLNPEEEWAEILRVAEAENKDQVIVVYYFAYNDEYEKMKAEILKQHYSIMLFEHQYAAAMLVPLTDEAAARLEE